MKIDQLVIKIVLRKAVFLHFYIKDGDSENLGKGQQNLIDSLFCENDTIQAVYLEFIVLLKKTETLFWSKFDFSTCWLTLKKS